MIFINPASQASGIASESKNLKNTETVARTAAFLRLHTAIETNRVVHRIEHVPQQLVEGIWSPVGSHLENGTCLLSNHLLDGLWTGARYSLARSATIYLPPMQLWK